VDQIRNAVVEIVNSPLDFEGEEGFFCAAQDPPPTAEPFCSSNKECVECLQTSHCIGSDGTINTYCDNNVLPFCNQNTCECAPECGVGPNVNTRCADNFCCKGQTSPGPGNSPAECVPRIDIQDNIWLCTRK